VAILAATRWRNYAGRIIRPFPFLFPRFDAAWSLVRGIDTGEIGDARPAKVRQMHPGHDLKSKSTSLHRNRRPRSNEYICVGTLPFSLVSLWLSSSSSSSSILALLPVADFDGLPATETIRAEHDAAIMI